MNSASTKRIRLFSPAWESIVLILGVLPATFLFWNPHWITEKWQMQFIGEILFLNTIHNGFSIYIIWRSREIRTAISKAFNGKPWKLHGRALAVFVVSTALFWVIQSYKGADKDFIFIVLVLLQFLSFHHGMSQQLGFSLLYDRRARQLKEFAASDLKRLFNLAKYERYFHYIAVFGVAIRCFTEVARARGVWLPGGWLTYWSGHIVFATGTAGVVAVQFLRPRWHQSNQWIYNLRRAWNIMPIFNLHFTVLQKLNHGIEYLALTKTIETNAEKIPSGKSDYRLLMFIGLAAVIGFLAMHRLVGQHPGNPFDLITTAGTQYFSALSIAGTLAHYYYDSQIYRFSQEPFREHVLPLMTER